MGVGATCTSLAETALHAGDFLAFDGHVVILCDLFDQLQVLLGDGRALLRDLLQIRILGGLGFFLNRAVAENKRILHG